MSDQCKAEIYAGPGHQSRYQCVLSGTHHDHKSGIPCLVYEWSDCQAEEVSWSNKPVVFSTFFNESPGHCDRECETEKDNNKDNDE